MSPTVAMRFLATQQRATTATAKWVSAAVVVFPALARVFVGATIGAV
jgi:hypothetical protein